MSKQDEYKKIYIQESNELLQEMNKNLLVLERETANINALNAIFRAAHTLKSMSASMGYRKIADLSHKMEDLLEQLRRGVIKMSSQTVQLLFDSFDILENMVSLSHKDKRAEIDISDIINKLNQVMVHGPDIADEKVTDGLLLNEFDKKTLFRAKEEGYLCYQVQVVLDKNCVLKSVRAFMIFRNLHTIGEVIKSVPDSSDLEEEKFEQGFYCVFITKNSKQDVRKKVFEVLDVNKVIIKNIKIEDSWKYQLSDEDVNVDKAGEDVISNTEFGVKKIQSVRVEISRLDKLMNLVEELAINKLRLTDVSAKLLNAELQNIIEELDRLTNDLQTEIMQIRLVPVRQIFDRFPRFVRDLSKKEGKNIGFEIIGSDIELERTVLDEIGDSLIHLLKNAIDHGAELPEERKKKNKPEQCKIVLLAKREKNYVFIEVKDDGRGIDIEKIKAKALEQNMLTKENLTSMSEENILRLIAEPGFSTKKEVTEISGRGVGLDVVKEKANSLGGSILIESVLGKGTKITMRLPITTAVVQALLVQVEDKTFAIPVSNVLEIIVVEMCDIKNIEKQETIIHRDRVLPIIRFSNIFSMKKNKDTDNNNHNNKTLNVVILEFNQKQFGIIVDRLISQQDIVIKQLSKEFRTIHGFAGATILGDGSVALVIDVATLM